ncbi:DEAD/DEAH box helicase [Acinetobacter sp. TR3]|uniref:DEAD/DEAH box helicase n=1 Tax=Acinetobacter sp. TR3 TaxID=3003392 RepID=UPI0022AC6886|nr:AAA domain-containing protein [Acinetobacter sp. TR3]WAU77574.1 AAA domain-containing protein [Acinetobacter sp. TR3]
MKLHEFKLAQLQVIQAECLEKIDISENHQIYLFLEDEQCYLEFENNIYPIELISTNSITASSAKELIKQNGLWFLTQKQNTTLFLSGFIPDADTFLDLDIAVDEAITHVLADDGKIAQTDIPLAIDWLTEEFLVGLDDSKFMAFSAFYSNQSERQILLIGQNHQLEINEIKGYWQVDKISKKRPRGNYRLVLLQGELRFKDRSIAKKMDNFAHEIALKEHTAQHGDYIEVWKQYSNAQWEDAVHRANQINYLKYCAYESAHKTGYWYIYVEDREKLLDFEKKWNSLDRKKDEQVQLSLNIADWLDNQLDVKETGLNIEKKSWRAEIIQIEPQNKRILLKFAEKRDRRPPLDQDTKQGFLCLSIFAVNIQRKRQQEALNLIISRRNPMPSLHALLQGIEVEAPTRSLRKEKWKSSKTKALFKGGRPTIKQQEAIELGLNSSDLTIIIGPPGTGKTQVITALQQRISELSHESIQRSILLTSYQHDAVDNVVDRSNVMGIAGLRVGGKIRNDDDEPTGVNTIEKWATPIQKELNQLIQNNDFISLYRNLEEHLLKLRFGSIEQKQKSIFEIQNILDQLADKYKIYLSHDLKQWWEKFKQPKQSLSIATKMMELYPLIYSLRTKISSFIDDGIQRCRLVLASLQILQQQNENQTILLAEEQKVLEHFIRLDLNSNEEIDFTALSVLKNKLIDRCLPDFRPKHLQRLLDEDICLKLDSILNDINDKAKKSKTLAHLMILDKYRYRLMTSTGDIKETIAHYTAVLAATCQQAAGNAMQDLKAIDKSIVFENVIVDEAARATPLDLMIPMAMAKRRLILVGDHRQLPHMLDDKIEKELSKQEDWKTVQSEMLEQSLFQRLVENMQSLEEEKQQPKRVIMLDTQFRMHPILGDFISKNFYENHKLPPIKSGRPETDFVHAISGYEDLVCGFKCIQDQKQQRLGTSWHRPSEAEWIAQEAKRILDEKPELSVGVISFYSGQIQSIFKAMENPRVGLTVGNKIAENYRIISTGKNIGDERLRIGTVDAFQGKEFDVVFVSLVRTLPKDFNVDGLNDREKDETMTRAYGFLRVDNRLNVALSRQRSLLIVTGDKELIAHSATQEAVPALPAFLKLCGGQHGKIF